MISVSGITSTETATTKTNATKTSALGQEQFLTLLVAQLQHQDPLNPSDPTEFTAQLAQYSQLEQLFNLNDSMKLLAMAQNNSERLSSLSLIGQEVVVEESEFSFQAAPVQIGYKIDGAVSDASISIHNALGQTVAVLKAGDLSAGNHFLTWTGRDSTGNSLPSGIYSITISATGADGYSATVSPLVRSEVTGIDLSGREAKIVTALGEYTVSSIHGAYNRNQRTTDSSAG
ncbi:MAG: flagellar hook assembly protein FlgD [Desulfobulbus sp.]|nr:flagellar hook assembly protein FlgD [Desulfobulbus sp.]